jgi:raffinose/stachyose/melibiose transport system permease protein
MNRKKLFRNIGWDILGCFLSLVVLIPLYFALVNSFKVEAEANLLRASLPKRWAILENYLEVIERGNIFVAFKSSMIVTFATVVLAIIFASMAAFVMERKKTKMSGLLDFFILMGIIVPPSIVPTFFLLKLLALHGTYQGVILIYIALYTPVSIILYKGYFKTVPREIDEAAIIDGCNFTQLYWRVVFPLLKPVSSTVFIIIFMSVWNDFTIALYFLNTPNRFTLPLTVYFFFGQYFNSWNLVFADVILIALPVVAVYFFAQKSIIAGMTAGAIKG